MALEIDQEDGEAPVGEQPGAREHGQAVRTNRMKQKNGGGPGSLIEPPSRDRMAAPRNDDDAGGKIRWQGNSVVDRLDDLISDPPRARAHTERSASENKESSSSNAAQAAKSVERHSGPDLAV
ncbi:MAG TPA: hypothetical protein VF173_30100 [Thermoanaerobaculia bacterium]|nr:hypothetical protein [Thermoanaerobaculia bacterium]